MIPAHVAMLLPAAALSEEDAAKLAKLEAYIDKMLLRDFRRAALEIELPEEILSPVLVAELTRLYGDKSTGWDVSWKPRTEKSFTGATIIAGRYFIFNACPEAMDDESRQRLAKAREKEAATTETAAS